MSRDAEVAPGLVVVDKPGGLTSHDVVARVRRLARTRRVGHAGTLDPMATGVLVLGVGRATRLLGHLTLTEKTYDATVRLGAATTTDDAEGEVVSSADVGDLTEASVRRALLAFVGEIDQVPSAVSAVKVDGQRSYARVRAGESVELAARRVTVSDLAIHRSAPVDGFWDLDITLRCTSGTYVRAIARDLGAALGVGGHLTALRRTAVGPFGLDAAATLEQLGERFEVLPIAEAVRRTFPVVDLDASGAADVRVGRRLELALTQVTGVFAPEGDFLALYRPDGAGARPVAVFTGSSS